MNSYDVGDWVRYKGVPCRVLGHWHDKQWTDYLVLSVPENAGTLRKDKRVTRWRFVGTALPEKVEPLIKDEVIQDVLGKEEQDHE